jgi:hypothetical protein
MFSCLNLKEESILIDPEHSFSVESMVFPYFGNDFLGISSTLKRPGRKLLRRFAS